MTICEFISFIHSGMECMQCPALAMVAPQGAQCSAAKRAHLQLKAPCGSWHKSLALCAGSAPEVHEGYVAAPNDADAETSGSAAAVQHPRRGALEPPPPGSLPTPEMRLTIKEFQVCTGDHVLHCVSSW